MKNLVISVIYLISLGLIPLSATATEASSAPLHILLTNDDGIEAPGIKAIEKALATTNYRVSIVAPKTQQSATSMKVTTKKLTYEQLAQNRWAVLGSPADSIAVALELFLKDDQPDIIISGANFGQNLGSNTNLSGTVGAALMGMQMGVPGIAISVGMQLKEAEMQPTRFPSTLASFAPAAEFTIRLVRLLETSRSEGASMLPQNMVLNVNYPALSKNDVKPARIATVARRGGFVATYVPSDAPNELKVILEHEARKDPELANADIDLFNDGHITVSILEGHLGASRVADYALINRIPDLFK